MNKYFINESNHRLESWLEGTSAERWHLKVACEAVFFSTQERFGNLTVLNDLTSHKERTAQFAPPSLPPTSKGVVSEPRTWKTAPRALGNAMTAQVAFLSLARDFPKNFARIIVQKSMFKTWVSGITSARGFTRIFEHFDAFYSR